jgi:hypothetical protein
VAICPNGHSVEEGQKFCPECGARVGPDSTFAEDLPSATQTPAPIRAAEPAPPTSTIGRRRPPYVVPLAVLGVAIIGLLLWLVLSNRGGPTGPLAEKHDIRGTLTAPECGGGYEIENASVEVRDEDDKLIGSATTGSDIGTGGDCKVEFTVADVPKASFYQVKIGTHGGPSYSYSEMKSRDWSFDLSLG